MPKKTVPAAPAFRKARNVIYCVVRFGKSLLELNGLAFALLDEAQGLFRGHGPLPLDEHGHDDVDVVLDADGPYDARA